MADALYPRDAIRMEWPAVRKIGAGLANLGNTCFMNAVMQCLTYTPPLAAFCLANEHKRFKPGAQGFSAMYEMGEHVNRALGSSGRTILPSSFVKNLRVLSKTFRKGRQEDAHEFARCLLDAMHKKCIEAAKPKPKEGSARAESTFVYQVFGGRLRSQVVCKTCGRKSDTFDSFMDLSLDVARAKSVSHALKNYVAVEVLDGSNKYKCQGSGGKAHMTKATKQFTIQAAPLVLTIQLKRFEYVPFGRGKLNQFVEYPLTLDISAAMSDASPKSHGKEVYSLFGVLVHSGGSMHSGHYYCYVKSATGIWYEMDDEGVSPVSEKTALGQRAYLLFYTRNGGVPGCEASDGERSGNGAEKAVAGSARKKTREGSAVAAVGAGEKQVTAVAKVANGKTKTTAREEPSKSAVETPNGAVREEKPAPGAVLQPKKKKAEKAVEKTSALALTTLTTREEETTKKRHVIPQKIDESRVAVEDPTAEEKEKQATANKSAKKASPVGKNTPPSSSVGKSPRRGKFISAKDSSRLLLMRRRLQIEMTMEQLDMLTHSPVKTRAARRAHRAALGSPWRERTHIEGDNAAVGDSLPATSGPAAKAGATAHDNPISPTVGAKKGRDRSESGGEAQGGDGKAAKQWLNRSARLANIVGRGRDGGWDDSAEGSEPRKERSTPKGAYKTGKGAKGADEEKPGWRGFKRRREYDDLDEDYDRGRVSKHQRRKAEGKAGGKSPKRASLGGMGKSRNPFQSAAKLKKETR